MRLREIDWGSLLKHYGIHGFALLLLMSATFHTFIQFSDELIYQVYFGAVAIFAALFAQYLRGLARAYRIRKDKWDGLRAFGLWIPVIVYIIVLEFTSAFGIIMKQVELSSQEYVQITEARQEINDEIKDIETDITTKKKQQRQEFLDRGRGRKYDAFETEILKLEEKKSALKNQLNTLKTPPALIAKKTTFTSLQEVTTIPENWFKIAMIMALMALIFLAPLLTPWQIRLEDKPLTKVPAPPAEHSAPPARLQEVKTVTDDKSKIMLFVKALYAVDNIDQLRSFSDVYNDVKGFGVTYRECMQYMKVLGELGAIVTAPGKTSRGVWTKDELLEYIEREAS